MIEFLTFVAVALSLPALILGFVQLVAPQSPLHESMLRRFTRFKLSHLMGLVVICGLFFAMATVSSPIFPFSLIVLILAGLFLKVWRDEFVFLMGRNDSDFPGPHDKLVWVVVLLVFAPAGTWFFRSYRLAHWPEPEGQLQPEMNSTGSTIPNPTPF
jgi:hypothetical protein